MELTPKQKQELKALGHNRKVLAWVGKNGSTEAVIKQIKNDIEHHELVKIRISDTDRQERLAKATTLAESIGASIVQSIGQVVLLYRPNIKLPRATRIHLKS